MMEHSDFGYFGSMHHDCKVNPFQVWDTELAKAHPSLSRMAYDMLAIPASSTSVERLFSVGGLIVTKCRNRAKPDTVRQLLCINKWLPVFGRGVVGPYIDV